jgi:hypothetical protein
VQRRCFCRISLSRKFCQSRSDRFARGFDLEQVKLAFVYYKVRKARCHDAAFAAIPFRESSASQDLTDLPAILTLSKSNWELLIKN